MDIHHCFCLQDQLDLMVYQELLDFQDLMAFQEYQDVMHLFSVDGDMAVSTTTKLCMYKFVSAVFLYNRLYLYIMHSICVNRKNIKPDFWKSKFA